MKHLIILALTLLTLTSCQRLKDKSKEAIKESGTIVGAGASQFADGVSEGVDKTFKSTIVIGDNLKAAGFHTGKFSIENPADTVYKLSVYCVFDKDLTEHVVFVKVFDAKGQEYGRSTVTVSGKAGSAHYYDIIFDPHTKIESRSKFELEMERG